MNKNIFNFSYPEREDHKNMANHILNRWEKLLEGLERDVAVDKWVERMITRFKNGRRGIDAQHPDVMSRKRKHASNKPNLNKSKSYMFGVTGYCPPTVPGEDETSFNSHINTINQQSRMVKSKRNLVKLNNAMDKSFSKRRQELVSGELNKITQLREKYPVLFEEIEVIIFSLLLSFYLCYPHIRKQIIKIVPLLWIFNGSIIGFCFLYK